MKQIKFNNANMLFGILIIAAGVLLLLFKAGILPPACQSIVFSWPVLVIGIGLLHIFSQRKKWFGLVLMLVGGFFLLPKLNIEGFQCVNENRWAIILVIIGLIIVFTSLFGKDRHHCCRRERRERFWQRHIHEQDKECGYIYREYVCGGGKESINVKNFKGGKISCVCGGLELDLSNAELADGVNTLEIRCVFGGVEIYVPLDWHIEIRQHQVLGAFEDKRPKSGFETNNSKTLIIYTDIVLGGGVIKCK